MSTAHKLAAKTRDLQRQIMICSSLSTKIVQNTFRAARKSVRMAYEVPV
jgi:hypothetical protein